LFSHRSKGGAFFPSSAALALLDVVVADFFGALVAVFLDVGMGLI